MAHDQHRKAEQCPNCGTALQQQFAFCPQCGQENHDLKVPFRHMAFEVVEGITHFDSKLWDTLKMIFTRPGQLTREYVEGRRARYVKPIQFYLFVSVTFFWLLGVRMERRSTVPVQPEAARPAERTATLQDIVRSAGAAHDERLAALAIRLPIDAPAYAATAAHLRSPSRAVQDSLLQRAADDTLPGARAALLAALPLLPHADSLDLPYEMQVKGMPVQLPSRCHERFLLKPHVTEADVDSALGSLRGSIGPLERRMLVSWLHADLTTPAGRRHMGHDLLKTLSMVMFLLMPFAALLLMIFFRGYYWQHLLFSLHIHTTCFLFFIALLVLELLLPSVLADVINALATIGCPLYLLVALRRMYGLGRWSTVWRTLLLLVPYGGMVITLVLGGVLWGIFSQ